MADRATVVILGTADWDQPIATNQHYVAAELARAYDVRFVESIGLRRPELAWRDLRRIGRRLLGLVLRRKPAPGAGRPREGVTVVSPFVLPLHVGPAAVINRYLVARVMKQALAGSSGPLVLWTYNPVTYGAEERFDGFVYHCVDLLGEVDGISAEVIARAETSIAGRLDRTIATTDLVAQSLRARGHDPVLWPNVADTATLEAARPVDALRVEGRVVFAGNLAPQKVDFDLLRALLADGVDLHLAGPIAEGGGEARHEVDRLVAAGATYHGSLTLPDLANLYWSACVGLIPYVINDYTRGVSPLKTYEYLTTGLAVVSTPVPSVVKTDGHVDVVSGRAEFLDAVERHRGLPDEVVLTERFGLGRQNSWVGRGEEARRIIGEIALHEEAR